MSFRHCQAQTPIKLTQVWGVYLGIILTATTPFSVFVAQAQATSDPATAPTINTDSDNINLNSVTGIEQQNQGMDYQSFAEPINIPVPPPATNQITAPKPNSTQAEVSSPTLTSRRKTLSEILVITPATFTNLEDFVNPNISNLPLNNNSL